MDNLQRLHKNLDKQKTSKLVFIETAERFSTILIP